MRKDWSDSILIPVQVQHMMENGKVALEMGKALFVGVMAPLMKGNGQIIMHQVQVFSNTRVAMFTKEIGNEIELMAKVFIKAKTVASIEETGSMISSMAQALKCGKMAHSTKVTIKEAWKKVWVLINGPMVLLTQVSGLGTWSMGVECRSGAMGASMKASLRTILWMALAFTLLLMAKLILATTKKIRNMAMVYTHGQMVKNTKGGGL
jgi:hypothetical protein